MDSEKPIKDLHQTMKITYDDVPLEGSLGLLAAGYKGILLWRNKRKEHMMKIMEEKMSQETKVKSS